MLVKTLAKKKNTPRSPADNFHSAATDLIQFLDRRSSKAGQPSRAFTKRRNVLQQNFKTAAATMLATSATDPTQPSIPVGSFFSMLSAGLIDAQRNLDNQSAAYLDGAASQPHVLPSIFRIPKVSAEMKFAYDASQTTGFNLLFYQDQQRAEEQHQQTIQFDIVAAPPPPNLVAAPAIVGIVRVKSDRQAIQKAAVLPTTVTDFDRVIILELIDTLQSAATATGARQFVLFYADATGALGAWALQIVTSNGTSSPTGTILSFGPAAPSLATLQSFLSSAGDRQKAFLASLS